MPYTKQRGIFLTGMIGFFVLALLYFYLAAEIVSTLYFAIFYALPQPFFLVLLFGKTVVFSLAMYGVLQIWNWRKIGILFLGIAIAVDLILWSVRTGISFTLIMQLLVPFVLLVIAVKQKWALFG